MGENQEVTMIEHLQTLNDAVGQSKNLSFIFSLAIDAKFGKICFSTSLGQEDQVLTDYIFTNNLNIDVFTLDTGRLFQETYDVLSLSQKKYNR